MNNTPSLPNDISGTPLAKQRDESRAVQQILYGHASSLLSNESFQYFLETVVDKRVTELTNEALDTSKTSEECDLARKKREEVKKIADWAKETRDSTRTFLQKAV